MVQAPLPVAESQEPGAEYDENSFPWFLPPHAAARLHFALMPDAGVALCTQVSLRVAERGEGIHAALACGKLVCVKWGRKLPLQVHFALNQARGGDA